MSMQTKHILFDCQDPQKLAQFWGKALEREVKNDWGGFIVLERSDDTPHLAFYKVDESKTGKNRLHLDFKVDDLADDSKRLVSLGAALETEHKSDHMSWNVMTDPEGNEFCISESF